MATDPAEKYYDLIVSMKGQNRARKVADKIRRDHPDLAMRARLAASFASIAQGGLHMAYADLLDKLDDETRKEALTLLDLLDVVFYALGGQDEDEDDLNR